MLVRILKLTLPLLLVITLGACTKPSVFGKNGNFRLKDAGPDEFAILPTKELAMPEDYTTLPEPTPGTKNRVDLTPESDAVAALGGKPEQLQKAAIGTGEQALITAASRNGVSADIRATLAKEDAKYRHKHRAKFFQRWIYSDASYLKRLENQSLLPYPELQRLRAMGVQTPAAPPKEVKKGTGFKLF